MEAIHEIWRKGTDDTLAEHAKFHDIEFAGVFSCSTACVMLDLLYRQVAQAPITHIFVSMYKTFSMLILWQGTLGLALP